MLTLISICETNSLKLLTLKNAKIYAENFDILSWVVSQVGDDHHFPEFAP